MQTFLKAIGLLREYRTSLDYSELKQFFHLRINQTLIKGYVNAEQAKLYLNYNDILNPFRVELPPIIQLYVHKDVPVTSTSLIQVSIIPFWVWVYSLFPICGVIFFFFSTQAIPSPVKEIISLAPLLFYPFIYGMLIRFLRNQFNNLVNDLESFRIIEAKLRDLQS